MPTFKHLVDEVSLNIPLIEEAEILLEYPGEEMVGKAKERMSQAPEYLKKTGGEIKDYVVDKASKAASAIDDATGIKHSGVAAGGAVAAAAGGLALRSYMKHRAKKAGVAQAQKEMAGARSKMKRLGPKQKALVAKRGKAMREMVERLGSKYGILGVDTLCEAIDYQYQDISDVQSVSVSEIADVVAEAIETHVLNEQETDFGGMDGKSGEDVALIVGGSVLVGAAAAIVLGKVAQWMRKAVSKGMSRDKAQATLTKAKDNMKNPQFQARVRAATKGKKR